MNTILKLDDLIEAEKTFTLNGKTFTLNTSIKAFVKFLKWNQELSTANLNESDLLFKNIELLEVLIKEKDFKEEFESLSFKSQTKILNKILEIWNAEINSINEQGSEKEKK